MNFIGYGCGKSAKNNITEIQKIFQIEEIWDKKPRIDSIHGVPVVTPREIVDSGTIAIIFIENDEVRHQVSCALMSRGMDATIYYRDVINYFTGRQSLNEIDFLTDDFPPVLFDFVRKELKNEKAEIDISEEQMNLLRENLQDKLSIDVDLYAWAEECLSERISTIYELCIYTEKALRRLLFGGVKTLYRPIRMTGDRPYDSFAIYEALLSLVDAYSGNNVHKAVEIIDYLRTYAKENKPLWAASGYYLSRSEKYQEAISVMREASHRYPNDLLINDVFYQVAIICKNNNISVSEPLPDYELNSVFCWSGVSFAWCGEQDGSKDGAAFKPCFRPNQCPAAPEGEFWSGEEWIEFRKSVTDGTFRYCQKTECPNIVGGWLPKKADVTDDRLRKILNGDLSVIPEVDELHFSYDPHCNLCCPSCRLEMQTDSAETVERFDSMYQRDLEPLVKNAKHLCLSGCGEAMLSPHCRKILSSLSPEEYPELEVELRTNVTSITPNAWGGLGDGNKVIRHIAASIDAAEKETFEKLRYPAKWEQVLKNLEFIQTLRNDGKLDMFEFHVVTQEDNVEQLYDIVLLALRMDADAVTFSRIINWRGMDEDEYDRMNPFWPDHPKHDRLMQEFDRIQSLRDSIENGKCDLRSNGRKFYISMHFRSDPNDSYDVIRSGRIRIR